MHIKSVAVITIVIVTIVGLLLTLDHVKSPQEAAVFGSTSIWDILRPKPTPVPTPVPPSPVPPVATSTPTTTPPVATTTPPVSASTSTPSTTTPVVVTMPVATPVTATTTTTITVTPATVLAPLSPLSFGTNLLWNRDNDAALANPVFTNSLRTMGIKSLRFPGGALAEQYNWKNRQNDDWAEPLTNTLAMTDYDEFIALTKSIGATPNIVVNVHGGYVSNNKQLFVNLAADWVRDAKAKGYNIPYWEIGNEVYHPGTRYSLTAAEYADSVIAYSKAMKAVNPAIKIGAVGPTNHTAVAFMDTLTTAGLTKYRSLSMSQLQYCLNSTALPEGIANPGCTAGASDAEFARWLNGGATRTGTPWWDVVATRAKGQFDFIVIHRYETGDVKTNPDGTGYPQISTVRQIENEVAATRKRIQTLQKTLITTPPLVPFAVTEYNVGASAGRLVNDVAHSAMIAKQMVQYLRMGPIFMNYWPLTMTGHGHALLEPRGSVIYQVNSAGKVMKFFSEMRPTSVIASNATTASVYTLATKSADGKVIDLLIVNTSNQPMLMKYKQTTAKSILKSSLLQSVPGTNGSAIEEATMPVTRATATGTYDFTMPALGIARVTLQY